MVACVADQLKPGIVGLYRGLVRLQRRLPKWPPRLIFAGACHIGTVTVTCDKTSGVCRPCRFHVLSISEVVALDSFAVEF